jgi:hypothetical protein
MKKPLVLVLIVMLPAILAACAPGSTVNLDTLGTEGQFALPGPNPEVDKPAENGHVAGIVQGIWHGFISPVTLILSFFRENVHMYEVHNDGKEYNLGFLLGVAIVFLVLGFTGGRRR